MTFVVDASMAAAWMLPDEHSPATDAILQKLLGTVAEVLPLFWHEARNVLLMAERRGRIGSGEAIQFMDRLRRLPLEDAGAGLDDIVLGLATTHGLSVYDAAYLALAVEAALPLATLDRKLATAARGMSVALLGPLSGT